MPNEAGVLLSGGTAFCALLCGGGVARGRFVIGGIETGSLEDDLGGGDNFLQSLFAAFRAGFQWIIGERLLFFELNSTIFTAIGINGHLFSPCFLLLLYNDCGIIACIRGHGKPCKAACYNFLTNFQT